MIVIINNDEGSGPMTRETRPLAFKDQECSQYDNQEDGQEGDQDDNQDVDGDMERIPLPGMHEGKISKAGFVVVSMFAGTCSAYLIFLGINALRHYRNTNGDLTLWRTPLPDGQ